jgi:RHS repeat-associated protein
MERRTARRRGSRRKRLCIFEISTIDGTAYSVDSAGNRTAKTDQHASVTSDLPGSTSRRPGSPLGYGCDAIYELLSTTQGSNTTESYTYDAVGNRLSSLGVSPYSYNSSNELTSDIPGSTNRRPGSPFCPNASYTYDSNGNTLTKTASGNTTSYTWDYENRLKSVTLPGTGGTVTFKYDPFGRRAQKVFTQNGSSTTTNYLYDGADTIEERDQNGNVLARCLISQAPLAGDLGALSCRTTNIDEPLAESRSGTTSSYQQDGLGSVTTLTNSSGAIANSYTYDSYGNLTASTGSITNPFRYTGREFDTETSLYYYRARYYDATIGRFFSEDPSRFASGTNDFFTYVENFPLNFRDPLGLQSSEGKGGGGATCCQKNIDIGKKELENALNNPQLMTGKIVKKYQNCLMKFPNMKIICDPTQKGCGLHLPLAVNTIVVTPLGTLGRKGPCGPVASTFLHEMVHVCYNNDLNSPPISGLDQEKETFGAECEVFGIGCACARDPKKCGY